MTERERLELYIHILKLYRDAAPADELLAYNPALVRSSADWVMACRDNDIPTHYAIDLVVGWVERFMAEHLGKMDVDQTGHGFIGYDPDDFLDALGEAHSGEIFSEGANNTILGAVDDLAEDYMEKWYGNDWIDMFATGVANEED